MMDIEHLKHVFHKTKTCCRLLEMYISLQIYVGKFKSTLYVNVGNNSILSWEIAEIMFR